MKKIRFMLFALLAMLYATNASALIKGNKITRDGLTYEVTYMDVAHDGLPDRYEAKFVSSNLSGALTIPSTVTDIKDGAFSQMKGLTSINVESGSAKYSATDGVLYENKTEGKFFN